MERGNTHQGKPRRGNDTPIVSVGQAMLRNLGEDGEPHKLFPRLGHPGLGVASEPTRLRRPKGCSSHICQLLPWPSSPTLGVARLVQPSHSDVPDT